MEGIMDRYSKIGEIDALRVGYDKALRDIDEAIFAEYVINKKYDGPSTEQIVSKVKEKVINEAKDIYDSAISILIHTVPSKKEGKYVHYIYLADFDKVIVRGSNRPQGNCDVNLTSFFTNLGLDKTIKNFGTSSGYRVATSIIRDIILDMFANKEYHSWDEVKTDLLAIPENYAKPRKRDTGEKYKARVLEKAQ